MDDIDTYVAEKPLRSGKLNAWEKEIIALRRAGASYRYICRYLASKGTSASPGEVQRYMHRRGRQQLVQSPVRMPVKQCDTEVGAPPKFDWPPKNKSGTPW